jgi:hypothetical protein
VIASLGQITSVWEIRRAYGVVWLDEGVVDGDNVDIVVLDAAVVD